MKIKNDLLIEKINQAIISHNNSSEDKKISLIKNGEIRDEDIKKIDSLYIDISDIPIENQKMFFEELNVVLKNMKLNVFQLYSNSEKETREVDMAFLSNVNKDLRQLNISGIDLSKVNSDAFNQFKNLDIIVLENNNIRNLKMISKLNEKIAIDVGNNPIDNVSINEVANEIKKHSGRIVFNEHPFWNTIVLALKNKEIDLNNSPIPKNLNEELLQFCKDYNITTRIKIEDYKKLYDNLEAKSNIIISGTKDISTEFLIKHPEISKIQIIDEENNEDMEQEEPYTREDFFEIRRKIDEIKEKIEIPDDLDEDKEKKIFMQVYTTLGKMIDYNYYAITKEGEKDKDLEITCRNLKDGLLKGKAVCAGYADILKNILGEFGIKAKYISRQAKEIEQYAKKIGYEDEVEMCEELGEEVPSITEFVKRFNYQDDHGHAWNSVVLDGEKYLCDLTWDADDIKCGHFPLHNCCQNLEYFNENGHDMYEEIEEGEISEISYEEQLRLSGYSEEEIERRLNNENEEYIKNLTEMLEQLKAREELESCAVSISSEIKASDFDGIERAFDDKEKEEQVDYDK